MGAMPPRTYFAIDAETGYSLIRSDVPSISTTVDFGNTGSAAFGFKPQGRSVHACAQGGGKRDFAAAVLKSKLRIKQQPISLLLEFVQAEFSGCDRSGVEAC